MFAERDAPGRYVWCPKQHLSKLLQCPAPPSSGFATGQFLLRNLKRVWLDWYSPSTKAAGARCKAYLVASLVCRPVIFRLCARAYRPSKARNCNVLGGGRKPLPMHRPAQAQGGEWLSQLPDHAHPPVAGPVSWEAVYSADTVL
jgi:hypothetical protein